MGIWVVEICFLVICTCISWFASHMDLINVSHSFSVKRFWKSGYQILQLTKLSEIIETAISKNDPDFEFANLLVWLTLFFVAAFFAKIKAISITFPAAQAVCWSLVSSSCCSSSLVVVVAIVSCLASLPVATSSSLWLPLLIVSWSWLMGLLFLLVMMIIVIMMLNMLLLLLWSLVLRILWSLVCRICKK